MDIQIARDNIGKQVVLNEDTKPYAYSHRNLTFGEIELIESSHKLNIKDIDDDGNVIVSIFGENGELITYDYILPTHLSLATPTLQEMDELEKPKNTVLDTLSVDVSVLNIESVELRLAIFNGDTSRTLEEMQAIEAWLLNK